MHRKFFLCLAVIVGVSKGLVILRLFFAEFANTTAGKCITAAFLGWIVASTIALIAHEVRCIVSASSPNYKNTLVRWLITNGIAAVVISALVAALYHWQWWIAGLVGGSATIAVNLFAFIGQRISVKFQ